MATNLLRATWGNLDPAELRLVLDERIGGPGQYSGRERHRHKLYIPLAGAKCKLELTFTDTKIDRVEPGEAFDSAEWKRVADEIDESILDGPTKIGRQYSFSGFRVPGSWRGKRSGLQILPPHKDAPRAPVEIADHPFILEFPVQEASIGRVTNYRLMHHHRRLTSLFNVLLTGRIQTYPRRSDHLWATVPSEGAAEVRWVQRFFFAKIGEGLRDELSSMSAERLSEVSPDELVGHDGQGLRTTTDLDDLAWRYLQLMPKTRERFDRAAFWFDVASRAWTFSISASFAALVSAIESLTERGQKHRVDCPDCGGLSQHEAPGMAKRFRDFLESYAGERALEARRNEMYDLRSGILHGSRLMQLDQDLDFGWDPPDENQRELHDELWSLTRTALRNWLKEASDGQVRDSQGR